MSTEFQIIDRFLAPFGRGGPAVVLGPGDDCALLRATPGTELCVTTDALVEGVHFDPALFSGADIGHKALAVNLSDLAAMGASPRWFVCSVACRPDDVRRLAAISKGMAGLANRAGIALAGGNFSRADALSLHITAAGEVPRGRALRRTGARPGDLLYVTGTLGDAALGLATMRSGRKPGAAFRRQARPEPRLKVGLAARGLATAAIDISDGLLQDLTHLIQASGVGAVIDARKVPLSRSFRNLAGHLELALTGGEDYELLLSVPPAKARRFEQACLQLGEAVTLIGELVAGGRLQVENAPHLRARGWDHFAGRARRTPSTKRPRARVAN
jgi:thiamine-monophosphate kinase